MYINEQSGTSLHRQCYCMIHYFLISGSRFEDINSGSRFEDINSGSPFVSGSGIHSIYLKFLDICPDASIFRNVNDGTTTVTLPSTIYIGRRIYHTLYVKIYSILLYYISLYFHLDKF